VFEESERERGETKIEMAGLDSRDGRAELNGKEGQDAPGSHATYRTEGPLMSLSTFACRVSCIVVRVRF